VEHYLHLQGAQGFVRRLDGSLPSETARRLKEPLSLGNHRLAIVATSGSRSVDHFPPQLIVECRRSRAWIAVLAHLPANSQPCCVGKVAMRNIPGEGREEERRQEVERLGVGDEEQPHSFLPTPSSWPLRKRSGRCGGCFLCFFFFFFGPGGGRRAKKSLQRAAFAQNADSLYIGTSP